MTGTNQAKPTWHIVIPFYFGLNKWVTRKGGAPVNKKILYLKKTIASLNNTIDNPDIIIAVCNDTSAEIAKTVHSNVKYVNCSSKHLCYDTVTYAVKEWGINWPETDIVMYNEDDQELFMAQSVQADIEAHGNTFTFAPHRFEQTYWLREFFKPHKSYHLLRGIRGILNNANENLGEKDLRHTFNHTYTEQPDWGSAFAACWAMHIGLLRKLDLYIPEEQRALESSTIMVYSGKAPALKLTLPDENPENFLVNHLSAYDYYRRIVYFGKIFASKK